MEVVSLLMAQADSKLQRGEWSHVQGKETVAIHSSLRRMRHEWNIDVLSPVYNINRGSFKNFYAKSTQLVDLCSFKPPHVRWLL